MFIVVDRVEALAEIFRILWGFARGDFDGVQDTLLAKIAFLLGIILDEIVC